MGVYFSDSSALVKRYVGEPGSGWVQSITRTASANRIFIARITWVEVLSALARRQREGHLQATHLARAIQALRYDFDTQYFIVELDSMLTDLAGDLVLRHPLRAYDAVQLSAALRLQSLLRQPVYPRFLSADERLINAAKAEGMATDNPNDHR